jgi:hypothetical protein
MIETPYESLRMVITGEIKFNNALEKRNFILLTQEQNMMTKEKFLMMKSRFV